MVSMVDQGVTKLTPECRVRLMRTLHTHFKVAYQQGHVTLVLGTFGCERDAKLPPRHVRTWCRAVCAAALLQGLAYVKVPMPLAVVYWLSCLRTL
jgi:hypothetical protein